MLKVQEYCRKESSKPLDDQFSTITVQQGPESLIDEEQQDLQPCYQDEANDMLYTLLRSHIKCRCLSDRQHQGFLSLHTNASTDDSKEVGAAYHTAFARCLSTDLTAPEWARLRFEVLKASRRQVAFDLDTSSSQQRSCSAHTQAQVTAAPKLTDLCKMVALDVGSFYRKIQATQNHLLDLERPYLAKSPPLVAGSAESLRSVLHQYELSDIGKILLAHVLTSAVWQYYNSAWMASRWKAENIYFMRHRSAEGPYDSWALDPLSPFVEMDLAPDDIPSGLDRSEFWTKHVIHPAPRILALGVALVSIFYGPLEDIDGDETLIDTEQFCTCKMLLDRGPEELPLELEVGGLKRKIHTAISACFICEPLEQDGATLKTRRAYLLEKVVQPINTLVQKGNFNQHQLSKDAKWIPKQSCQAQSTDDKYHTPGGPV